MSSLLTNEFFFSNGYDKMSEITASIFVFIENEEEIKRLRNTLKSDSILDIPNYNFEVQEFSIDTVIHCELISSGHDGKKEIAKWLKGFQPSLAAITTFDDYGESSFGLKEGKRCSFKNVVKELKSLSKKIETGLVFNEGTKKILDYLNSNDVNIHEKFQGFSHIDRLISDEKHQVLKHLIERKLVNPNHVADIKTHFGSYKDHLLFHVPMKLAFELVNQGADINSTNYLSKSNLLQTLNYDGFKIDQFSWLIENGINVNHKNKDGQTPLHILCKNARYSQFDGTKKTKQYIKAIDLLIDNGADPFCFDSLGATCAFYAKRRHDVIFSSLKDKHPDLPDYDPQLSHDEFMVDYIGSRSTSAYGSERFYEECIEEGVLSVFEPEQFSKMVFRNIKIDRSIESKRAVVSRFRSLLKCAIDNDSLEFIKALHSTGLPLFNGALIGGIVGRNDSKAYLRGGPKTNDFLSKLGYSKDHVDNLIAEKRDWIAIHGARGRSFEDYERCSSKRLTSDLYEKKKNEESNYPVEERVANSIWASVDAIMTPWGDNVWYSEKGIMLQRESGTFKFITAEEAFELSEFNFEQILGDF